MQQIIQLKNSFGRLTNREPFILAENERYCLFFESEYALKDCVVTFKKDGSEKQYHFKDLSKLEIPQEFIGVGTLEIELCIVAHGKVQARYHCEPIVFTKIDTFLQTHPELEEVKQKIALLEQYTQQQNELINSLSQRLDIVEGQVREIWEYEEQ